LTGVKVPIACLLRVEHPFGPSSKGALIMVVVTEKTCGLIVLDFVESEGEGAQGAMSWLRQLFLNL